MGVEMMARISGDLRAWAAGAAIVLTVVVGAACGSHPDRETSSSPMPRHTPSAGVSPSTVGLAPSPVVARCGEPDVPARTFPMRRTADGLELAAVEAGGGPRGVVLIHERGSAGLCGWWEYAAYLSGRGFHVLLFDHLCTGQSGCPHGSRPGMGLMADIETAVGQLRGDGAAKVVLVGGSQGASEAVIAASTPPVGVVGVVALSADELAMTLAQAPYPPTARDAAPKLKLPALFAVAASDRYVSIEDTRVLVAAVGSPSKRLVEVSAGAGHGWDLVTAYGGATRPPLSDAVVDFLTNATS
jgi:alpha-beta hydrolase superfamily lysophospholipase